MGTPITTTSGNTYSVPSDGETDWGDSEVGPALIDLLQNAVMVGGDIAGIKLTGPLVHAPLDLTVAVGSTIPSAAACYFLTGQGGPITVSATTPVQAGTQRGQQLVLVGGSATAPVTIPDSGNLNINGSVDLELDEAVTLLWTGSRWIELSRTQ